jgi:hypothetical protein
MCTIACTGQSEGRGRNRWFRIAEAVLTTHAHEATEDTRLCLHVYSRRRGQIAPVVLVLTISDAAALAQAVLDAVQQVHPILPAAPPCCPRCQATAPLAYGACSVEGLCVVQDAACLTCGTGWHDVYLYRGSVVQDT